MCLMKLYPEGFLTFKLKILINIILKSTSFSPELMMNEAKEGHITLPSHLCWELQMQSQGSGTVTESSDNVTVFFMSFFQTQ